MNDNVLYHAQNWPAEKRKFACIRSHVYWVKGARGAVPRLTICVEPTDGLAIHWSSELERKVLIGDKVEIITSRLGQPMDEAFDRLYAAFFGKAPMLGDEFQVAALQYLDTHSGDATAHDRYFNCFTVIWNPLVSAGRLDLAENLWTFALGPVQHWEQAHPGQLVHKGTPYYFWAMTTLLCGNLDRGYVLMHQAFQEDALTSGQQTPDTPAYALVSLNYEQPAQAFQSWVLEQASFFEGLVDDYATTHHRPLTIDDVRLKFLRKLPIIETVFLLTFTVARLKEISSLPDPARRNPFAGQVQMNLLFDLLLVVDNAIKHKNPAQWKFIHHAKHLLHCAGHGLALNQLQEVNRQFDDDFNATLKAALDGTLTVHSIVLDRLQCDVAVAYGLRNRGAHEIETVSTIWNDFDRVLRAVFRTLCATIDHLY